MRKSKHKATCYGLGLDTRWQHYLWRIQPIVVQPLYQDELNLGMQQLSKGG